MVERVVHELPQLQVTVISRYSGWIFDFISVTYGGRAGLKVILRKGRIIRDFRGSGNLSSA